MRVAVFVDHFPVLSETFVLNQVTGLIDAGCHVDIFRLHPKKRGISKPHPDYTKYHLAGRIRRLPRITGNYFVLLLKFIGILLCHGYKNPALIPGCFNVFRCKKIKESVKTAFLTLPLWREPPYDIIHCQFGTNALEFLSYRSCPCFQGKLVVSFRGYDISRFVRKNGADCYDDVFAAADQCLSNSAYFKQRLIEMGCEEKKTRVYFSGIDCSRFAFADRKPAADGRTKVVYVGRLVEKKGLEYSIRGFAQAARVKPDITFDIVGEGRLRQALSSLITELNMVGRIRLLGAKTQDEIIHVLDRSHICLAASVTASDGNQDGPVNTLKEAMAMGLPVIGTRHGGIPELIEDGVSGFLVPERDADAITGKLLYLIDNPGIWPEVTKSGRAAVEDRFDVKKLNNELLAMYNELMKREKPE